MSSAMKRKSRANQRMIDGGKWSYWKLDQMLKTTPMTATRPHLLTTLSAPRAGGVWPGLDAPEEGALVVRSHMVSKLPHSFC